MIQKVVGLALCILLATFYSVSAAGQQSEKRPLELKYEFEDDLLVENKPVKIKITAINNSDEEKLVRLEGIVRYMVIGTDYNSDALSEHPTIPAHGEYIYNFSQHFIAGPWSLELRLGEVAGENRWVNNTGTSFNFVVQPVQDVYLRESAQYESWTAAGTIGAALAAVGAVIYSVIHNRRAFPQMKAQSKATQDQVRMMAQQLYDDQLTRWEERYHEHSKHVVEAISEWINRTFIPFISEYRNGEFRVNAVQRWDDIPLLEEGRNHFVREFPKLLSMFEEMQNTATKLANEVEELMTSKEKSSFEFEIIKTISTSCSGLTQVKTAPTKDTYRLDHLFETIFDGINHLLSGKEDELEIVASDGLFRLNYRDGSRTILVAYGQESNMIPMMNAMRKLWHSEKIQTFVKEFHRINSELEKNSRIKSITLRNELEFITVRVNRGVSLQSYGACKECPTKPVPPQADEVNQNQSPPVSATEGKPAIAPNGSERKFNIKIARLQLVSGVLIAIGTTTLAIGIGFAFTVLPSLKAIIDENDFNKEIIRVLANHTGMTISPPDPTGAINVINGMSQLALLYASFGAILIGIGFIPTLMRLRQHEREDSVDVAKK